MKKFLIVLLIFFFNLSAYGVNSSSKKLQKEVICQKKIDEIGVNLLNANKIDKKIVFTYNEGEYKKTIDDPTLTKRQIIFYEEYFKYVENDDELAAYLAREISRAVKSYSGAWGGIISSVQVKAACKKYEIFADKRAVNYMVKAGYNPIALITFINKTKTNGLLTKVFHNSPTKRMSVIYEYIYYNYPYYLKNNEYLANKNYQNFLLNTRENRRKFEDKLKTGSFKEIKYE